MAKIECSNAFVAVVEHFIIRSSPEHGAKCLQLYVVAVVLGAFVLLGPEPAR